MRRWLTLSMLVLLLAPHFAWASEPAPAQTAEDIRTFLVQAQVNLDSEQAQRFVVEAQAAYSGELAQSIAEASPEAHAQIIAGFVQAKQALADQDQLAFAYTKGVIWTSILAGSYYVTTTNLDDPSLVRRWLILREFRQATRFSRPNIDATEAVESLMAQEISSTVAQERIEADLLDTYQGRFNQALHELRTADTKAFITRRAESAGLAWGYFQLLAPAYAEQRGSTQLQALEDQFALLQQHTVNGSPINAELSSIEAALAGFRAAPLSNEQQARRANQFSHFVKLVSVEYGRGISNGQVKRDFEIREGITFRNGAAAAFADLQGTFAAINPEAAQSIAQNLAELETILASAGQGTVTASPSKVEQLTTTIQATFEQYAPAEWLAPNTNGDFDMIATILDEMETAAASGQYDMAESSRLEAYAVLETGPEAKLTAFAPQYIPAIEGLFWYGQDEHQGLARLIEGKASIADIRASRAALDKELSLAQKALSGDSAPTAVALNAALIVFREGLEAVLILASLMASFRGANKHLRKPLWSGAAFAFVLTIATWFLARGVLASLARYGERLEAVVSLVAIGVLLLITNWFFHKVYWTGWIASFHARKRRLSSGAIGQWIGLATLGVTSIYREGFETVLFLQALVLESGTATVLAGVALGLAGTALIGVMVFALQARLPYKKMLIFTGVLIGAVLLVMVGNTVHVLQVVGWMPLHPIRSISFPYWYGMWFGLYSTWEGIAMQVAAAVFVIGSYVLAERVQKRKHTVQPHTEQESTEQKQLQTAS